MSENGKIVLIADDGSEDEFFVLEKAEIAGASYLLVADSEEEEADALILKECGAGEMTAYETVADENELKILSRYFEELLEDEVELRLD